VPLAAAFWVRCSMRTNAWKGRFSVKLSKAIVSLVFIAASIGSSAQTFSERNPEYVLQRGDVLDVRYRYTPEFDQVVTVRPDGWATLLNIDTIVAAGMTLSKFKETVVTLSSKLLVNPEVTVLLKEFEKPHVFVEGEVANPGRVDIRSDITILDAIALAGGFKTTSAKSKVLLLQHNENGEPTKTTVLDLNKLINDKLTGEITQVHPGDVIYVTQNNLSKIERLAHLGQFGAIYNPIH
jgi:polysaccharide export outer membrane protein